MEFPSNPIPSVVHGFIGVRVLGSEWRRKNAVDLWKIRDLEEEAFRGRQLKNEVISEDGLMAVFGDRRRGRDKSEDERGRNRRP